MPVHNALPYVGEAIASVLAQRFTDWELVVWDDGSTDGSLDAARLAAGGDPRVRFFAEGENRGTTHAVNQAVAQTSGEYIGVVDADDRLLPAAIRETVALLDRRPRVGLAYTRYRIINERGEPGPVGRRCQIPYAPNRLLIDFMVYHQRLFRRRWFDHLGGLDESYRYAQDYEFCLRMSEVAPIQQVPQVLHEYRVHDRSVSQVKRAEQRACAARAVRAAISRRGMADHFALDVGDDGSFRLRKLG